MRGGWTRGMQWAFGLGLLAALAGCVAPGASPPPPSPPPLPAPVARPAAPVPDDWRDVPLTAGKWTYATRAGGSEAYYGAAGAAPLFLVRCDATQRRVMLLRARSAAGAGPSLIITTSSAVRALPVQAIAGAAGMIGAILPARDSFLDAMAFSRGRFVVASAGEPSLYIPAWPEFARVIEDCRG